VLTFSLFDIYNIFCMFQQPSAKAGSKLRPSTEKTEKAPGVFLVELGRYREEC
jgi:hypothetical protein